ncbi:MAG: hypothetical protein GXO48_02790 [Chlorobi bacterium]|nr:hypothetical protein [Chlorobiota bacterium]
MSTKGNYGGFYAFVSMTMMLFLAGLLAFVSLFAYELGLFIKEQIVVSLELHPETDSTKVQALYDYLKKQEYVKEVVFIDKEKALELLKEPMPDIDPELLGYNPLADVIEVRLEADYVSLDKVEELVGEWKARFPFIREVIYNPQLISQIEDYIKRGILILGSFTLILLLATVLIINSTLRLAIYTRRFIIKNMQMIGASWWFIIKPLLGRAVLLSILSFLVASLLIGLVVYKLINVFPEAAVFIKNRERELLIIAGGLFLIGFLVSVGTTFVSVIRFLRMRIEDLY